MKKRDVENSAHTTAVNRCVMCGDIIPEGGQVCKHCADKVGDPLKSSSTGNPYYDYLVHEVQVVCNCPANKAMAVVAYVNSLGSNPVAFIRDLPAYLGTPHPDVDEVLKSLEHIRDQQGAPKYGVCFPEGYQNRKARRADKQEAKRQAKQERKQQLKQQEAFKRLYGCSNK